MKHLLFILGAMFFAKRIIKPLDVVGTDNNTIFLQFYDANQAVEITCDGEITITSTKYNQPVVAKYSNLNGAIITIQSDANKNITITGNVKEITRQSNKVTYCRIYNHETIENVSFHGTNIKELIVRNCKKINLFDISATHYLEKLELGGCNNIFDAIIYESTNAAANAIIELMPNTSQPGIVYMEQWQDSYWGEVSAAAAQYGWQVMEM